jgi:acetylglutamate kinase
MSEPHALRVRTLVEALPYIQQYRGATFVIKYGGSAMSSDSLSAAVMQDVVLLGLVGVRVVLVHGGGPQVSEMMRRLGKEPTFVQGQRVTDAETMEIAQMVLAGKVNKEIAGQIQALGGRAVGLSGRDGGLLRAGRKTGNSPEGPVDLGFVGQVSSVDARLLESLTAEGYIPVVCSIGTGESGESLNINADHAAGCIAAALRAQKVFFLTDVRGLMRDPSDPESLVPALTVGEARAAIAEGWAGGGMIPKLNACIDAVESGAEKAHIVDGRIEHAVLVEVFTDEGIGTMVVPDA